MSSIQSIQSVSSSSCLPFAAEVGKKDLFSESSSNELFGGGQSMEIAFNQVKAAIRELQPQWAKKFIQGVKTQPLPQDPHSNAQPQDAKITHMDLEIFNVDHERQVLSGKCVCDYKKRIDDDEAINPKSIFLDVQEGMIIKSISVQTKGNAFNLEPDQWSLKETGSFKPMELKIPIDPAQKLGKITIEYETSPAATGLYWRKPEMTDGKEYPMLFTQAEPNDGSSFFPSQHSPQVRFTYSLKIHTDNPNLIALGSAEDNPKEMRDDGVYVLHMRNPIPAYLLGFTIGHFQYVPFNNRCGVYAEPVNKQLASERFAKLESFITTAEELFGSYVWKEYNPILLPLAYPYGAMEHPCASFIGGDCVDRPNIIPHELAHSWFGNMVTNGRWGDIFFNEGLTSYAEKLICEACISEDYAKLNAVITLDFVEQAMDECRQEGNLEKMKLCAERAEEQVDISYIPYGKGMLFFVMLEEAIGKDNMLKYLKDYSNTFAFKSMSQDRFLNFLGAWLKQNKVAEDFEIFMEKNYIEEWLNGAEYPSNKPNIECHLLNQVQNAVEDVILGNEISYLFEWNHPSEVQGVLLRAVLSKLENREEFTAEKLSTLYTVYGQQHSGNNYLWGAWSQLFAKKGCLIEETKTSMMNFLLARNSKAHTEKMVSHLLKHEGGEAFVEAILEKGRKPEDLNRMEKRNYLDASCVAKIETLLDAYKKTKIQEPAIA